jgi:uncharacterized protein DUF1259
MKSLAILLVCAFVATAAAQPAKLDTAAIDKAIGRAGQMQAGDVYKVSLPRTDLSVTVAGLPIKAGLALGSWAAFKSTPSGAVAHGDLVLTEREVNPVILKLQQEGLDITALHNHVLEETPRIMYLHFWGAGDAAKLARSLHDALALTKTPLTDAPPAAPAAPDPFTGDAIQQALGLKGTARNGVLALSVPRPEKITMMGVELPPSMGMATAINVQSAGAGKVAATGDFVMVADEVNKVARALRSHGIAITALHSHMIHGSPELYFMHFWAVDAESAVGAGLKAALDAMKRP